MDYVRREVEERQLVEEAVDLDGIEGFGHVEENSAGEPLFAEIPDYSFNDAGQLQRRVISGCESELLVSHQSAFFCHM